MLFAKQQYDFSTTYLQEMEFEAIQPTRTYRDEERSARVGGVDTQVVEQIPFTVYNVEKITARVTNTPTLAVGNLGLDPGQLGALLQVSSSSNSLKLNFFFLRMFCSASLVAACSELEVPRYTRAPRRAS